MSSMTCSGICAALRREVDADWAPEQAHQVLKQLLCICCRFYTGIPAECVAFGGVVGLSWQADVKDWASLQAQIPQNPSRDSPI